MILFAAPILLAVLLARSRWVIWQKDRYEACRLWYCFRTKQSEQVTHEMALLWPGSVMVFEIWRWDWRRYVVHQEHFDAMVPFIAAELRRNDLDWDVFKKDETHGDN